MLAHNIPQPGHVQQLSTAHAPPGPRRPPRRRVGITSQVEGKDLYTAAYNELCAAPGLSP
jgi:hypothetical protein